MAETTKDRQNKKPVSFRQFIGIFRFIYPYRTRFILGMLCLLVSSVVSLSFPYVAGKLLDIASGTSTWFTNNLNQVAVLLLGILIVQAFFSFARVYLFTYVSEYTMADVRSRLFNQYMTLPMAYYDTQRSGELISRITADVSMLQNTFSYTLAEFFRQVATLLVGVSIILFTSPRLAVFMLATFPVLTVAAVLFGRHIRKLAKKAQDELAQANVIVEETLSAIQAVKSFTSEWIEVKRYRTSLNEVVSIAMKNAVTRGGFVSFLIVALFGGIVAVVWYGATLVQSGSMTVGDLLSFVLYTTFIGASIAGLGDIYGQLQKATGASERVLEILGEEGEMTLEEDTPREAIRGDIVFDKVGFAYPTRQDVKVLDSINLHISQGEKVALVGHSGAGKSTITQLLLRFYAPTSGTIYMANRPVQSYNLKNYRANLGIVPQDVTLFGGTIKENIAYGKPDASIDEIREAASRANALDFIEGFPDQFNTVVGERGVKLSGGQRQRVAIARTILKDPALLILDEATSALDAESESLVQQALDKLMENRTTIIIAHRLATIRKVDTIYVIDQGRIVESGSHQQLLNYSGGAYSNLVKLQLQED